MSANVLKREFLSLLYYYFFECTPKDTLTAKNGAVSPSTPYVTPESLICTRDHEHLWPFHIVVLPGFEHQPSKAVLRTVLQLLAACQVSLTFSRDAGVKYNDFFHSKENTSGSSLAIRYCDFENNRQKRMIKGSRRFFFNTRNGKTNATYR